MCIWAHTTKNPWHKDVLDRQMYNCVSHFCTYPYGLSLNGWHALLCIANNRHGVTITTRAIKRHILIWMTTVRQPTKRQRTCVLTLKYTFICVYWWTRQRIHNTLIVVDRYLRLMGDKQRVLMHGHQGWNVRHGLCHIYMRYVYIYIYELFIAFVCFVVCSLL